MLLAEGHPAQAVPLLKEAMQHVVRPAIDMALLSLAYADQGESDEAIEAAGHAVEQGSDGERVIWRECSWGR